MKLSKLMLLIPVFAVCACSISRAADQPLSQPVQDAQDALVQNEFEQAFAQLQQNINSFRQELRLVATLRCFTKALNQNSEVMDQRTEQLEQSNKQPDSLHSASPMGFLNSIKNFLGFRKVEPNGKLLQIRIAQNELSALQKKRKQTRDLRIAFYAELKRAGSDKQLMLM